MHPKFTNAIKIIESVRYQIGCQQFLNEFIPFLASLQSGRKPVMNRINSTKEFQSAASRLSHEVHDMCIEGQHDVLGPLLEHFGDSTHGFFPTPEGLSALLSQLMTSQTKDGISEHQIYEPCAGTGSITFSHLIHLVEKSSELNNPLENTCLHVEDISEVKCHAFFLQFIYLLQYFKSIYGRDIYPKRVTIQKINVLSRHNGKLLYDMSQAVEEPVSAR